MKNDNYTGVCGKMSTKISEEGEIVSRLKL
jgi:hypothetical protein